MKFLGALMIIGAGGFAGLSIAQNYLLRPRHLRSLLGALQMLATEIRYGATPLPAALQLVGARTQEGKSRPGRPHTMGKSQVSVKSAGWRAEGTGVKTGVGAIFTGAGRLLETAEGLTATEAWSQSVEENKIRACLNKEDLEILCALGGALGSSDREDQEKHLLLAMEQLKIQLAKAEDGAAKNGRLWQYLGFMGGLVCVFILL